MEHLKAYYTIEKHLEETSKLNPQFEILNSIWKLNKGKLTSALSNVSHYFPHYSLHDSSHSQTIIRNIEAFLGEDRIKRLGPTNAWLILMSAYTHDIGMVVFQDLVQKEWWTPNFQNFLKNLQDSSDDSLKKDSKLLLQLQKVIDNVKANVVQSEFEINDPISIKNAVTTVVAEYTRKIHHEKSSEIIKGANEKFYELANSFYSDQIPSRLLNTLGDIAYLHGVDFYQIFEKLDFESNGLDVDNINPRFIACLLRLGDLLDIDDSRFNQFSSEVFKFPKSSIDHKTKHSSVKHLLVTPDSIEITLSCQNENVYRIARSWFDWLEKEVELQGKEWSNISPRDLGGKAPTIPRGKIKVFYMDQNLNPELLDLRFQISNKRIFEIIEGSAIYENAEFTFIRELVQNALDASKIELWMEITSGKYNEVIKTHLTKNGATVNDVINEIRFPNDIPTELTDFYKVKLSINWTDQKKEEIEISVEDFGTGISDSDLIRMTSKVGESRKGNEEMVKLINSMPFWLKPTGAFGIGLQSVFIVCESFDVETKAINSPGRLIQFNSSKRGKYSSVKPTKVERSQGTKVIVNIPKNKFQEVFNPTFDLGMVMEFDAFTSEFDSLYIYKLKAYLDLVFQKVRNLEISFFGKELILSSSEQNDIQKIATTKNSEKDIECSIYIRKNDLIIQFFEATIGSEFILIFETEEHFDLNNNRGGLFGTEYFVREIPVKSAKTYYHKLSLCRSLWNFTSTESDQILSLSREKLLTKKKIELEKLFFSSVLQPAFHLASSLIEEILSELSTKIEDKDTLKYLLFKFQVTAIMNKSSLGTKVLNQINDYVLDIENCEEIIASSSLTVQKFLNASKIILPVSNKSLISGQKIDNEFKSFVRQKCAEEKSAIIVWNTFFFEHYLRNKYHIHEIKFTEQGNILVLGIEQKNIMIKDGYTRYLDTFIRSQGWSKRAHVYAANKYANTLSVKNNYATGFESFPFLSRETIISPFKDSAQLREIMGRFSSKTQLDHIPSEIINELIPESLITWILKNTNNELLSKTEIIKSYKELISELLKHNWKRDVDLE